MHASCSRRYLNIIWINLGLEPSYFFIPSGTELWSPGMVSLVIILTAENIYFTIINCYQQPAWVNYNRKTRIMCRLGCCIYILFYIRVYEFIRIYLNYTVLKIFVEWNEICVVTITLLDRISHLSKWKNFRNTEMASLICPRFTNRRTVINILLVNGLQLVHSQVSFGDATWPAITNASVVQPWLYSMVMSSTRASVFCGENHAERQT